ncbi:MAG: hypothetical protein C0621_08895 [Desulfuromonas sp.]|nr:MAG: hypothetical protein C0621_08895 [Desulfuromonas sp.]
MADRVLQEVIALEEHLHQQYRQEQQRAKRWLQQVRDEETAADAALEEELRLKVDAERSEAQRQAEDEAAVIRQRALLLCEKVRQLRDDELDTILGRYLQRLLPGDDDDHRHVEG